MRPFSRFVPAACAALLAGLAGVVACDKATPVAPSGTVLAISANPTRIGLTGRSTIRVTGRKPDGNPLNPGTEIRLSSSLGTIEGVVAVDNDGSATATLRGDGRSGAATVTATTGDGTTTVTTIVQIGESDDTRPTLLVTVSPNTLPVEDTAQVTVIARNSDGSPVSAGQTVILTANLGSLSPSRPQTRNDGTAVSTFNAGSQAGTATITAILGASAPATATVTIRDAATAISVQANPQSVPRGDSTVTLQAFVTNSQGLPLQGAAVTFESQRGTLDPVIDFTDTSGVATATLTLRTSDLPAGVNSFTVTASTPSGTGTLLEDDTTIAVR
jgi:adhesin/invasin